MKNKDLPINGVILKDIIEKFSHAWSLKLKKQGNVMTFHDHIIKEGLTLLLLNMDTIPWHANFDAIFKELEKFSDRQTIESFISHMINWHYGRFVDYSKRIVTKNQLRSADDLAFVANSDCDRTFSMSQGRFDCLKWKDNIIFKTVYDLAIYQMLIWDLNPKTIIEIGSGTGGSAIWMSDTINMYRRTCQIISLDIVPPNIEYENIAFLKGDCNEIDLILQPKMLEGLPHPWLIIEDAHVNVLSVLEYIHDYLFQGDYLIVEDSEAKKQDINDFLYNKKDDYHVDSYYCDFFGHNLTCSINSIFRRN